MNHSYHNIASITTTGSIEFWRRIQISFAIHPNIICQFILKVNSEALCTLQNNTFCRECILEIWNLQFADPNQNNMSFCHKSTDFSPATVSLSHWNMHEARHLFGWRWLGKDGLLVTQRLPELIRRNHILPMPTPSELKTIHPAVNSEIDAQMFEDNLLRHFCESKLRSQGNLLVRSENGHTYTKHFKSGEMVQGNVFHQYYWVWVSLCQPALQSWSEIPWES